MESVQFEAYETIVEGMCVHELSVYPSVALRATTKRTSLLSTLVW
jgi:hypothetical protein